MATAGGRPLDRQAHLVANLHLVFGASEEAFANIKKRKEPKNRHQECHAPGDEDSLSKAHGCSLDGRGVVSSNRIVDQMTGQPGID